MWLNELGSYWIIGIKHVIPEGFDHLLFMLALFLGNPHTKETIISCSLFTLGHALSMILAAVRYLPDWSQIAEPCIAATIIIASLQNILDTSPPQNRRKWLILAFGFIHGCGFASALYLNNTDLNLSVSMLAGFNLGVETVQILIILLATLMYHIFLRKSPDLASSIFKGLSAGIALAGFYLLVEQAVTLN